MKPKFLILVCFVLLLLAGVASYRSLTPVPIASDELALAELQIAKMTCGSCVGKISDALTDLPGVAAVDIDLTTGTGRVTFDPDRASTETLVATVTESGYPATLKNLLNRQQYQALQTEELKLASDYVARIGEQLISRESFTREFELYLQSMKNRERPNARAAALQQSWQNLLQRTLLLQDAAKNQIVVLDGEVELRLEQMRSATPNFADYVQTKYGSEAELKKQLKEEMIISRNIDQVVLAKETDQRLRQQKLNLWFNGLVKQAAIVIYDPELKQATKSSGSGCGGGCCG